MENFLSIATINTWKGDGNYPIRMGLLKKELAMRQPQVVLLQESLLRLDGGGDTAMYLSKAIGGDFYYGPMRRKVRSFGMDQVDCYSGMAVLSTVAVEQTMIVTLPTNEKDGGRVGQWILVNALNKKWLIGNLHLSFLKQEEALKIQQLDCFLSRIPCFKPFDHVIIGGDFNSQPDSKTIKYLENHAQYDVLNLDYQYHQKHAITFPNPKGGVTIDYLFSLASRDGDHIHPSLIFSMICFTEINEKGTLPSDHYGLMAGLI